MKTITIRLKPEEEKQLQRVMKVFSCSSPQQYVLLKIRNDWLEKG